MMHGIHDGKGEVLFDNCAACQHRAQHPNTIDDESLFYLAGVAEQLKATSATRDHISGAEYQAIETLRLWARTVFASGITDEVAR